MTTYRSDFSFGVVGNAETKLKELQRLRAELTKDINLKVDTNATSADASLSRIAKRKQALGKTTHANVSVKATGLTRVKTQLSGINTGFKQVSSGTQGLRTALGRVAVAGLAAGAALSAMAVKGAKSAVELQSSYKTTENLITTGGESAKTAIGAVNQMQKDGKKYSLEYGQSQKSIADAYQDLVKRGHTSSEALAVMKTELQGSVASGDDFKDVVSVSSQVIEAFGMKTNNTAKMVKNTKEVVNDLAYSADATATNFSDLGVGMSYVGSSAHVAGISLAQTSAAMGELSNNGLEADKAGTGLRKVINSLTSPTSTATDALKSMGLTVDDFKTKSGSLKSLPQIFDQLNSKMAGMSKTKQINLMTKIFGTTGQQAAAILEQNSDALDKLTKKVEDSAKNDYVERLAKRNADTVKMQMARAKQAVDAFSITVGSAFLPAFTTMSQTLAKGLQSDKAQKQLKDLSEDMQKLGNSIAKYLVAHGDDLWDIAKALGSIGTSIAKGAWDTLSTFLSLITGHGMHDGADATTTIANALTDLSKHKGELEAIGGIIATVFVASKLTAAATAINSIYKGLLAIGSLGTLKSSGNIVSDVLGGAQNNITGNRTRSVLGGSASKVADASATTRMARYGREAGEVAGDSAGAGILSKITAKLGSSKILSTLLNFGKGIGGKLVGGISIAMGALDLFKGLTTKNNNTKYKDTGKGIGTAIGTGIGAVFGGPVGATIGATIGNLAGGWAGKATLSFQKGWNAWAKGYKPHGIIQTVGADVHRALHDVNNFVAQVEKKHPKIAVAIRVVEGAFKVITTPAKMARQTIALGFKNMWTAVSEYGTKGWSGMMSDISKNNKSWLSGIKKDLGNVWDTFTNNRKKEEKATSKSASSSKSSTQKAVSNLGSGKVNKASIANVKSMTKAIKAYGSALSGLKSLIKKNDPTTELNKMNKDLTNSTKNWSKLASPIKKMGNAFKTLASFSKSMSKNDAFADLAKDIPKLNKALKDQKIASNLKKIGSSIKNSNISSEIKKLSGEIETDTSKWKKFATPVKTVGTAFKQLNSFLKTFGKGDPFKTITADIKTLATTMTKNDLGQKFKDLTKKIQKNNPSSELGKIGTAFKTLGTKMQGTVKPMNAVSKAFNALNKFAKLFGGKADPFTKLNADFKALSGTLDHYNIGKQLSTQISTANTAVKKATFASAFRTAVNSLTNSLRSFSRSFKNDWKDLWDGLDDTESKGLKNVVNKFDDKTGDLKSYADKFESSFKKSWKSWIDDVKSTFKAGFDKLPGYAADSMKSIVSKMNKGISGVNSVISDFGGKKLGTIKYARGTAGSGYSGHPGGPMMVNDGKGVYHQELVHFPNGKTILPQGKDVVIPDAPAGTQVLSAEQSHPLLSAMGIPHYADGTGDIDGAAMEALVKNPLSELKKLFFKGNTFSGNDVIKDFGTSLSTGFLKAIEAPIKKMAQEMSNPPGSGVGRWRSVIVAAAAAMGASLSGGQISRLLRQIQTESGGNPTIKQGVSDINSRLGHPSQGLLQFIPSTFAHWAMPGHKQILNGADQIMAAINALNHGGEGGWSNIGNGHGWATGGHVLHPQVAPIAEDGDEYIINPRKPNAVKLAMDAMRDIVKAQPSAVQMAMPSSTTASTSYRIPSAVKPQQAEDGSNMMSMVSTLIDNTQKLIDKDNDVYMNTEKVTAQINHRSKNDYTILNYQTKS